MALGSTQPLTEMNTRYISWGKGGRCVSLTTLPLSVAIVMKYGNLNFLETFGPLQASKRTTLPLSLRIVCYSLRLNYNRNDPRPKPSLSGGSKFLPGNIVQYGFADVFNTVELGLYTIKTLFTIPNGAHNYKIIGILKTIKIPTIARNTIYYSN